MLTVRATIGFEYANTAWSQQSDRESINRIKPGFCQQAFGYASLVGDEKYTIIKTCQ
jgi:hypothetical protein